MWESQCVRVAVGAGFGVRGCGLGGLQYGGVGLCDGCGVWRLPCSSCSVGRLRCREDAV